MIQSHICRIDGDDRIDADSTAVLSIEGELDLHSVPVVMESFDRWSETAEPGARIDRIDARRIEFIGAAGVTALLRVCRNQPTPIAASPVVARLIELCGLGDRLVIDDETVG